MRRTSLAASAVALALVLALVGCGRDDPATDRTTTAPTTAAPADDAAELDPTVVCDPYRTVRGLFASHEEIATGSNDGQVQAGETLASALDALAPAAEGDDALRDALDTLGQVSFLATETDGGPDEADVDAALATLDAAFDPTCTSETGECPAPETLEAEGYTCDSEGNLTPIDGSDGGGDPGDGTDDGAGEETGPTECPAPETLEAEGYGCDSEGNLYPLDDPTGAGEEPTECPAPEVLEAEGYTCDSEGNLTPA